MDNRFKGSPHSRERGEPGLHRYARMSDLLASSEVGEQRKKRSLILFRSGGSARPDEIANAVVFLASDDANYITGTELFVDGGIAQVWARGRILIHGTVLALSSLLSERKRSCA